MKRYREIIFGGTCWAAGRILQGDADVLLIERSASIGAEYFDSYRQCGYWDYEPSSEVVKGLKKQMQEMEMLSDSNADCYGLLAILYQSLKSCCDNIMLMTELDQVKEVDGGYEVTVFNQSGKHTLFCEKITDNSLYSVTRPEFAKGNVTAKRLNASLFTPNAEETCKAELKGAEFFPGRSGNEVFLSYALPADSDWATARKSVFESWKNRPEPLSSCRISSFAKEFDLTMDKEEETFADNWHYCDSTKYSNPLQALDAGFGSS